MLGTSALLDQPPEWWTISSYYTMDRFIMRNTCSSRSSLHNPTSICSRGSPSHTLTSKESEESSGAGVNAVIKEMRNRNARRYRTEEQRRIEGQQGTTSTAHSETLKRWANFREAQTQILASPKRRAPLFKEKTRERVLFFKKHGAEEKETTRGGF
ncbi:unnamed protein product [Brassica rapa]|uniref:Uncharacterized protein n=2 Tax=Brassica TaxID=3705 RepID=A0A8D9LQF2_BRACM|nr:unnamed protein product [Brassica napus]CAG7882971.1 unnamed protein product [Brassica rapa]